MSDAAHSVLAASSAWVWVNCPGSVPLGQQYNRPASSEDAEEGTKAHAAAVAKLETGAWPDDVGEEMRDLVSVYTDYVERTAAGPRVHEAAVKVPVIHEQCFGTCDCYALDLRNRVARLYDFKYGWGIVEAFENWQLLVYANGVIPELGDDWRGWVFELAVVQPRPFHRMGPVRTWKLTAMEVAEYGRHLRTAAEGAMGNHPYTQVGRHCKYCPARHACPALQAAAMDAVEQAYDAAPVDLTPAALGAEMTVLTRAAALLETRLAGLQAEAMAGVQTGRAIPGWTIQHNPGRLEWSKPVAEVMALGAVLGVDLAKKPEPITPAQAKKAGIPDDVITAYAQRKSGAAKLVPIDTTQARAAFGGLK